MTLPFACECGLKPEEFYDLTFIEWDAVAKGYEEREKREWTRSAFVAYHLQPLVKHPKRMSSILESVGIKQTKVKAKITTKEDEQYVKEVFEALERKKKSGGK